VLAYRRDIFAKHDLKPPETYAEFASCCAVVKDKEGIGALTSAARPATSACTPGCCT
jgi:multiple sugar transport system substrate-binding protein